MDAYFKSPQTAAYFSDPDTYSSNSVTSVSSISPIRLGEPFTVTVNGSTDLTTATAILATLGGVSLAAGFNITANTISFTAMTEGLEVDASHDLVLDIDGTTTTPFSATFNPPSGYSSVTFSSIGENSFLNDPDYVANAGGDANNIGVNDQFIYDDLGGILSFSDTGLPTLIGGATFTSNTFVDWFYLDAQDGYLSGAHATLELILPNNKINLTSRSIDLSQYQAGSLGKVRGNDKQGNT